jgi:mannosyltransferase OCH1-like enzyme
MFTGASVSSWSNGGSIAMSLSIPGRIFQTDRTQTLPVAARAAAASIKAYNPDFEYIFYDDQQVENFFNVECPQYREIVESFPVRIQRYDFFRYLLIHKYGGFYFDTDMLVGASLGDLVEHGCVFPFERLTWSDFLRKQYGRDWEIGNYAFGAAPGHPFLQAIIENCVRAQTDTKWRDVVTRSLPRPLREELAVIYSTGPGLVSRTLAEYDNPDYPVTVLFPEDVCDKENGWNLFGQYGVHLGGGSWRTRHRAWRQRLINALGRRNEERAIKLGRQLGKTRKWEPQRP